ncbi:MAG: hypothetical protein HYW91_01850 [Candidatus Sungbacteria bacterium]|nr:hypothetical protein [Candidatus Sungbacteria bacterium]
MRALLRLLTTSLVISSVLALLFTFSGMPVFSTHELAIWQIFLYHFGSFISISFLLASLFMLKKKFERMG